jgi:Cu-processing system permease protein
MDKIWPIAAITYKEGIRNRALQGILGIAVVLCLGYLAILPMFAFETGKVMVDLGTASVSLAGMVIVLFLAISMLARDIHQRSVCMILSRPVSRPAYVFGKFGGMALMVLTAVVLISVAAVIASVIGTRLVLEIEAPRNFAFSQLAIVIGFKYLALLVVLSISFLFTVLTTSEYLSMLLTVMVYFIGNSLETIVKVASQGKDIELSPAYLGILKLFAWIFPNLSAFDLKLFVSYGLQMPREQILWTAVYGIFYILVVMLLTVVIFNRKEIR